MFLNPPSFDCVCIFSAQPVHVPPLPAAAPSSKFINLTSSPGRNSRWPNCNAGKSQSIPGWHLYIRSLRLMTNGAETWTSPLTVQAYYTEKCQELWNIHKAEQIISLWLTVPRQSSVAHKSSGRDTEACSYRTCSGKAATEAEASTLGPLKAQWRDPSSRAQ